MDNNNRIFVGLVGASNVLKLPDEIHNKRLLQVLELSFYFTISKFYAKYQFIAIIMYST